MYFSNFPLCKLLLMACGTSFSRILSGSKCSLLFMWKWTNVYKEWQIKLIMIPNLCYFNTKSILIYKILTGFIWSELAVTQTVSCLFGFFYICLFSLPPGIQYQDKEDIFITILLLNLYRICEFTLDFR